MDRAVLGDEDLQRFIDDLPSEDELLEELRALSQLPGALPERVCACCERSLVLHRKDAIWCSQACKQWGYEQRLKAAGRSYPRARSRRAG